MPSRLVIDVSDFNTYLWSVTSSVVFLAQTPLGGFQRPQINQTVSVFASPSGSGKL